MIGVTVLKTKVWSRLERSAILLALSVAAWWGLDSAYGAACREGAIVPYAGSTAPDLPWRVATDGDSFCLLAEGRETSVADRIPLHLERSAGGDVIMFSRRAISSHFSVARINGDGALTEAALDIEQRSRLHFEGAFRHAGEIYVLAYDVASNFPSGRRRTVLRQAHGLHRVVLSNSSLTLEAVDLEFLDAGIEGGFLSANGDRFTWICAAAECKRLADDASAFADTSLTISLDGADVEILELATDASGATAFALAQLVIDDRRHKTPASDDPVFFLCTLEETTVCDPLDADEIPFALDVTGARASWRRLRAGDDPRALFLYDLTRSGMNGLANFGENNLEGRMAWSQAYYWNGLLSALQLARVLQLGDDDLDKIKTRIGLEIKAAARILQYDYPGAQAKRYSIDREPIRSLLHEARILKPVWRAQAMLGDHIDIDDAYFSLNDGVLKAQGRMEYFVKRDDADNWEGYIRKYLPFWADGSRIPWNYQSAWVEGVVWSPKKKSNARLIAQSLLLDFIEKNELSERPDMWIYASGTFLEGWSADDQVSSNTLAYGGDTANPVGAHISYRSMDALAALAGARAEIIKTNMVDREYFGDLVYRGLLYPFINEELALAGERVDPPFHIARLYARSRLPWSVQSLPWALAAIASDEEQPFQDE